MKDIIEINSDQRIKEFFTKHKTQVGAVITKEEEKELRALLCRKYRYGSKMPEYRCPKCDCPLFFWWDPGVICPHSEGGCGWQLYGVYRQIQFQRLNKAII